MSLDTGDTAFMLVATALVMIMTPGLAFFYGGLVSRKNVLTIMMQSYVSMGVTTILLARTTIGARQPGDRLNVEIDATTRAVVETVTRIMEAR